MTELLDLGVARGLVDKPGAHPLGNGRERAREALAASTDLQSTLHHAIRAAGSVRQGRRPEAEA